MKKYMQIAMVAFVIMVLAVIGIHAQESSDQSGRHIYVLSTDKVQLNDIEQLLDQWETYSKKIVMENEYILSAKVFTQMYGADWTVATLLEYASLADLEKASVRSNELAETFYPDETERTERTTLIRSLINGGSSTIIRDVPVLTK